MALLSGLMVAAGWISALFSGWPLTALTPVGLSGFCGAFAPGARRINW